MFRPRRTGGPMLGPRLQEAFSLLAAGRYVPAGELLSELAERARENGHPLRAAQLALQAGHAFLQAGQPERAVRLVEQAARQFLAGRRPARAVRVFQAAIGALRAQGCDAQADHLEQTAQALLARTGLALGSVTVDRPERRRGHLPPACPRCGGPLRSDEVDWVDDASAECPYCSSVVPALPSQR